MQTILVINALNGSLPLVLKEKYPSAKITCAEVFPFFRDHLTRLGFEVVDWSSMGQRKFDLVIGNPPYQNSHDAKRWPLWHQFVVQAVQLATQRVIMITPNSWMGASDSEAKQAIWPHITHLHLDIHDHFPQVGSSFCWFDLDLTSTNSSFTVTTNSAKTTVNKTAAWLPNVVDPLNVSINQKFFRKSPTFNFVRGHCHTSNKQLFADQGYEVFHTRAQTLWAVQKPQDYHAHKAAISLSGYSEFRIGKDFGCSQAAAYMTLDAVQAGHAAAVLNGKLYQYVLKINKWSGWNSLDVIKSLPLVDLNKPWTDSQLYNRFGLSPQEIQLIEQSTPTP
jgi:site-specific DNA-methyltransferase (adenine-specific)